MATNTPNFLLPKPDANDNFNRIAYNALIDAIDSKVGAKTNAADTHMADLIKHITAGERDKWNAAQLFAMTFSNGTSKATIGADLNLTIPAGFYNVLSSDLNGQGTAGHMIVMNRGSSANTVQILYTLAGKMYTRQTGNGGTTWTNWSELETTAGAQAKVDAHAADAVKHITAPERAAWNGGQLWKLTESDGALQSISDSTPLATFKTPGRFRISGSHPDNPNQPYNGVLVVDFSSSGSLVYQWVNSVSSTGVGNSQFYRSFVFGFSLNAWRKTIDNASFGNVLFGNKFVDQSNANFVGKVAGSTTANPHVAKRTSGGQSGATSLQNPNSGQFGVEPNYNEISTLDSTTWFLSVQGNAQIAQEIFSFNLIEHVQRTYGTIPGATTADKVAWLKSNLSKLTFNWFGFGSSPAGNKASLTFWEGSLWFNNWLFTTSPTTTKVTGTIGISPATNRIDSNGFVHFLAYAEASDGTTASVINTDYVELNVELSTDIKSGLANATTSIAGLQSGADKAKLDAISAGANKTASSGTNGNVLVDNAQVQVYAHPTGDGNSHVPATGTTNGGKVLKAGATANALSWAFVDWSEIINKPSTFLPSAHTHAIADVTGLSAALSGKLDTTQRGAVNGVASLGSDGKVPTSQLPTIANAAADITIADAGNYFDGANVETGMQEIGRVLAGARTSLVASAQQLGVI